MTKFLLSAAVVIAATYAYVSLHPAEACENAKIALNAVLAILK